MGPGGKKDRATHVTYLCTVGYIPATKNSKASHTHTSLYPLSRQTIGVIVVQEHILARVKGVAQGGVTSESWG